MELILIFVALIFAFSLVSGRLEGSVLTGPMVFTAAGMLAGWCEFKLPDQALSHSTFLGVAEIGLVLLLFTDASRTDLRVLNSIRNLPTRLLSIGMLLTIFLGAVLARLVFPGLSIWEAGILAAILAPTDAGLGQVIVNSPRVPVKIREALNVEAGLNDGLSVPFLLFFMALATKGAHGEDASLTKFILEQLGLGTIVGLGIGLVGGGLLGWAHRAGWIAPTWRQLGLVVLPLLCVLACRRMDASMFIAAFVAGLAVQAGFKEGGKHSIEFTEDWGQLLNLSVFTLFGVAAAKILAQLQFQHFLYAFLSLTVVRMAPVAVALKGLALDRATVLFMGWFGPRGLASIVLGLVYLETQVHEPVQPAIRLAVIATVLCSVFAHGLTAMPGIAWYSHRINALAPDAPEREGGTHAGSAAHPA